MSKGLDLALARCGRGGEVADGDVESDVERSYLILMVEAGIWKNAERDMVTICLRNAEYGRMPKFDTLSNHRRNHAEVAIISIGTGAYGMQ